MTDTRRYYLPSSGAAPVSPAFGGFWDVTGAADRLVMSETPANTAHVLKSAAETVLGLVDVLWRQYVGPNDLPAGDVSGTWRLVIPCSESTFAADAWLNCRLSVYSADGATHRGDLFNGVSTTTVSSNSSDPNYEISTSVVTRLLPTPSGGALTPVTAQAGDRIVLDLGYRNNNPTTTSRSCDFRAGDPTSSADYPFTVDVSTIGHPRAWLELVLDDPLSPPDEPENLSVTPSADGTELQLDWDAAATAGALEDGYDVRIDGGSGTDVGNVLTHDFTGLTPDTAYTLEVRAYNAAGDSAWVSIGGTTTGPPDAPTGLVATPGETSVVLDWTASTGSPDGYEVRVDGGAVTDVGAVLTHEFEDLYPGTDFTLEVRAYNEAGFSAWASIGSELEPSTDSEYTAEITLGDAHTWTIVSGVCEAETVTMLDGLRIGWDVDESAPWPAQPNPVACSFQLWVEDVVDLSDVVIGTNLAVILTDLADNVFATFHGRVARMSAQARKRGSTLGMLYSVSAVDYTVDLAEYPVTIPEDWPAESADERFARIQAAIGNIPPTTIEAFVPPADTGTAAFEELTATTTDALSLIMSHLNQIAIDGEGGIQRYILVPVVAAPGVVTFESVLLDRTVDASLLPGVLDVVGGELVLTFPDMDADGVVDACAIPLEVPWNRLKYRAVTRVTVAGNTVTGKATRGTPPVVRLNLSTTLTDQDAADRMAELYLPDVDELDGWIADTFTLHAYRTPAAIVPAWFPDHRTDPAETAVYVMPLAVVGIADPINLSGDLGVYAGQLVKVDLVIAKQKVYVDFGLRRQLPLTDGADALTWDDVAALWPTLTWDDVSAALSWYDARLGKAP